MISNNIQSFSFHQGFRRIGTVSSAETNEFHEYLARGWQNYGPNLLLESACDTAGNRKPGMLDVWVRDSKLSEIQ